MKNSTGQSHQATGLGERKRGREEERIHPISVPARPSFVSLTLLAIRLDASQYPPLCLSALSLNADALLCPSLPLSALYLSASIHPSLPPPRTRSLQLAAEEAHFARAEAANVCSPHPPIPPPPHPFSPGDAPDAASPSTPIFFDHTGGPLINLTSHKPKDFDR
ncbi:hypothetical protein EYF80_046624 [Liparis tanakae]|uniref:Uncharacterized protein n=1 Tax=Liparis tanakae TaxID=230148 RepID=A0A4Z2FPM5_9TELE|nr:hypothetical protein EYF80_046624 [Liparis tanakae]